MSGSDRTAIRPMRRSWARCSVSSDPARVENMPATASRPNVPIALIAIVATLVTIAHSAAIAAAPAAIPNAARSAAPTCSMYFVTAVRRGPHAGFSYRGVLRMSLDASGRFAHGTLQLIHGGRLRVQRIRTSRDVGFRVVTRAGVLRGVGGVNGRL